MHFSKIFRSASACILFCTVLIFSFCNDNTLNKKKKHSALQAKHIGQKFMIYDLLDTAGNNVSLDITQSKYTIIDFWINECPPCNEEMSRFKEILVGKEKQISIISISVSTFANWKKLFLEKKKRYFFLTDSISNWKHLVMRSTENPSLKK